jgi:hypothetical protein
MKHPLAVIACLATAIDCPAEPVVIGYPDTLAVTGYSQSVMDQVGQLKWFFSHASVGENIMAGIESLHASNPTFYLIDGSSASIPPPETTGTGTIYDYNRGNPGWQAKVDLFANYVNNGWRSTKVDIALNKFCYVDWDSDVNYYINSMATLETGNPSTWFIYATIPLTTGEDSSNYQINVFNDTLRDWCRTNNRVLYDIADMEAHDTNGMVQTFTYNGRVCQKLFSGYTSPNDGGHLTTIEAQQLAAKGLYALAAALLTADRDNDGMPDWWEMDNGLNPLGTSDAHTDSDHDGMTNLNEYLSGTNPNNPASVLHLQIVSKVDGTCQMEFAASSNVLYTVQFNSTLSPNSWQTLANISSQPSERSVLLIDATSAGNPRRFYRVAAQRAPQ